MNRTTSSLGTVGNQSSKSAMLIKELQSLEKIKARQQREVEQLIEQEMILAAIAEKQS
jgi:hypothetical protein